MTVLLKSVDETPFKEWIGKPTDKKYKESFADLDRKHELMKN